jgi:hypothetical protein
MPLRSRDLDAYRRDERMGHKLLTPEQRRAMIEVRGLEESEEDPASNSQFY